MSFTRFAITYLRLFFLFVFVLSPQKWEIDECRTVISSLEPGDLCWTRIDDIRPSQFTVGKLEVQQIKAKLDNLSPEKLESNRWANQLHGNVAPTKDIYVYSDLHSVRALYESSQPKEEKWVYIRITNNYSKLTNMGEFFRRLINQKMLRLTDASGHELLDPHLLPRHVSRLQNDPYRSMASYLKGYGCWQDPGNVNFIDFYWADFFRSHLREEFLGFQSNLSMLNKWCTVRPYSELCLPNEAEAMVSLLEDAVELCRSPEAALLPGHIP